MKRFIVFSLILLSSYSQKSFSQSPRSAWISMDNILSSAMDVSWNPKNEEKLKDDFEDVFDGKICKGEHDEIMESKICEGVSKIIRNVPSFIEESNEFSFSQGRRKNDPDDDFAPAREDIHEANAQILQIYIRRLGKIKKFNSDLQIFKDKYGLSHFMDNQDNVLSQFGLSLRKKLTIKDYEKQVSIYEKLVANSDKLKGENDVVMKKCASFEAKAIQLPRKCEKIKLQMLTAPDEKFQKEKGVQLDKCLNELKATIFNRKFKGCPSYSGLGDE